MINYGWMATLRKLDAYGVYLITINLEYLRLASNIKFTVIGATPDQADNYILGEIKKLIEAFKTYSLFPIEVSNLERIHDKLKRKYSVQLGKSIDNTDADELKQLVYAVNNSWNGLLNKRNFIDGRPSDGVFDYEKVYNEGLSAFFIDKGMTQRIPREVTADLYEALKCLAFDLATPSVMVSLRACEGMLRYSHKIIFGKETEDRWFDVADRIFDHYKTASINITLLKKYDSAIRLVRNSAEHPGIMFVIREAEKTFDDGVQFVTELFKLLLIDPSTSTKV